MQITNGLVAPPTLLTHATSPQDQKLRAAAEKLEATFLAEMLKTAGLGKAPTSFGGGEGEDQFASFLIQEQAGHVVEAGGIGLAEKIFETLKEQIDAAT